jgi:hypothetical protein
MVRVRSRVYECVRDRQSDTLYARLKEGIKRRNR